MTSLAQPCTPTFRIHLPLTNLVVALACALLLIAQPGQAQTYATIHNFTGGGDGGVPETGLTMDAAGNLYGTTSGAPGSPNGTVFRLKHAGSGWILGTLYTFAGGNDGNYPDGNVAIASDGTLYGVTGYGGGSGCGIGCGTVYHLTPSPGVQRSVLSPWNESVIYSFDDGSDGSYPQGNLIFDSSGNIYGTAETRGPVGTGVTYELTPSAGGWTQTILDAEKQGPGEYRQPTGGLVSDPAGNLYGVFYAGSPNGCGAVYEVTHYSTGWLAYYVEDFGYDCVDGGYPAAGLIIDASQNLYGTTSDYGNGGGTVFELVHHPIGGPTFNLIYSLPGNYERSGPYGRLLMDSAGNLYGTTYADGAYGAGSVFKLTPSDGGWTYTSLHDFCSGGPPCSDGANPKSNLVLDANGNLYGTTTRGGADTCPGGTGCGVIFEITP